MNEKEWLDYVKKYLFEKKPVIKAGNEDCAVIKINKKYLLFTTDALVENIHFKLSYTSYFDLGAKLAVSNLSDIASMGGEPKWALLTLGSPQKIRKDWIDPFMEGLTQTLEKYGACLIGGDTVKSASFFINLALIGETYNPILRNGSKPGEFIFVSKHLGESSAFLRYIKKGIPLEKIPENLKKAHLRPEPEIILGKMLSENKLATSMIDISDGLLLDLWRICEENQIGAELIENKIPIGKYTTLEEALSGGEDYALLFTVKKENLEKIGKLSQYLNKPLFCIGTTIKEKKLYLIKDDQKIQILPRGYIHFTK